MARKSFTLQKITPDYGTYVQYPSGSEAASVGLDVREDNDTRLKSDGILLAPLLSNPAKSGKLLPYISFFEAEVIDYNEIVLTWDAPLNDLSLVPGEDTVVATGIIIVYSQDGEPQTISDGDILINDNNSLIYYHRVPSGKWSYYTLFVKFESRSGDLYYEPCAKLGVLTPKSYNSTEELYSRIPEYYRLLDGEMDEGSGGPLYRYLSIFGYEIDKMKTIINHMMVMKDPQVANSQVLDYISQDLGVGLRVFELGASRLRTLINIIGYLRRSEGTLSALELAIQALTGSDVEIDSVNKNIKVYAQRVNLLKDPNLAVLVAGTLDGGFYDTDSFSYEVDAGVAGTTVFVGDPLDGGAPSATGNGVVDDEQVPIWTYYQDPASASSVFILQSLGDYIPVKTGDTLYFSMQQDPTLGYQKKIIKIELQYDNGIERIAIATATSGITIAGIDYWALKIDDGYPNYVDTYIYIYVSEDADADNRFKKLLLERSIGGEFFDGDTSFGGWLVDSNTIADYRWYNSTDSDSSIEPISEIRTDTFSIYNSNYSKTRAVVNRLLTTYLPITELTTGTSAIYPNKTIPNQKWSVTFNHIPGVTYGVP